MQSVTIWHTYIYVRDYNIKPGNKRSDASFSGRKSCAITTAKRLGQFLGDERIKDKGLNCNYIVAKRPENLPTSERAIPLAIFSTSPAIARSYLRKWCGELGGSEIRAPQGTTPYPPCIGHVQIAEAPERACKYVRDLQGPDSA